MLEFLGVAIRSALSATMNHLVGYDTELDCTNNMPSKRWPYAALAKQQQNGLAQLASVADRSRALLGALESVRAAWPLTRRRCLAISATRCRCSRRCCRRAQRDIQRARGALDQWRSGAHTRVFVAIACLYHACRWRERANCRTGVVGRYEAAGAALFVCVLLTRPVQRVLEPKRRMPGRQRNSKQR